MTVAAVKLRARVDTPGVPRAHHLGPRRCRPCLARRRARRIRAVGVDDRQQRPNALSLGGAASRARRHAGACESVVYRSVCHVSSRPIGFVRVNGVIRWGNVRVGFELNEWPGVFGARMVG